MAHPKLAQLSHVINAIIDEFGIERELFYSRTRMRHIVDLRKAIVKYLYTTNPELGCVDISLLINKDHATAIYMNRAANDLLESNDYCFINMYGRVKEIAARNGVDSYVADAITDLENRLQELKLLAKAI